MFHIKSRTWFVLGAGGFILLALVFVFLLKDRESDVTKDAAFPNAKSSWDHVEMLQEAGFLSSEVRSNRTNIAATPSPASSATANPGRQTLEDKLERLALAHAKRSESAVRLALDSLFTENPGVCDQVLRRWSEDRLSPAAAKGALIFLQVGLVLLSHGKEQAQQAFAEKREALLARLLGEAFAHTHQPNPKLIAILSTKGVLQKSDLSFVMGFLRGEIPEESSRAWQRILHALLMDLGDGDLALLDPLLSSPYPWIRSIAHEILISLSPDQASPLMQRLHEMDGSEAGNLVQALIRKSSAEEISRLLRDVDPQVASRIDFFGPAFEAIDRIPIEEFEQKIFLVRGRASDATDFRAQTMSAFRAKSDLGKIPAATAREFFLRVFLEDESPQVRGPALYNLANYWPTDEAQGLEDLLNTAAADPIVSPLIPEVRKKLEERRLGTKK